MDRRTLIGSSIGIFASFFCLMSEGEPSGISWPLSLIVNNIPPGFNAARLGREYLRRFPSASNRKCAVSSIIRRRRYDESIPACHCVDETGIDSYLARLIEQDFDSGTTHNIDGWIYADTELRLCALTVGCDPRQN